MTSSTSTSLPPVYISDRGEHFPIDTMENSHLINVIAHHLKQIKTLDKLTYHPNIAARRSLLSDVIHALTIELASRKPHIEEYLTDAQTQRTGE